MADQKLRRAIVNMIGSLKHGAGGGSAGYSGGRAGWRNDLAGVFAGHTRSQLFNLSRRAHMIAARMGVSLPSVEASAMLGEGVDTSAKVLPASNWEEGRRTPMSDQDLREFFWLVWATLKVKFDVERTPGTIPDWAMSAARSAAGG